MTTNLHQFSAKNQGDPITFHGALGQLRLGGREFVWKVVGEGAKSEVDQGFVMG